MAKLAAVAAFVLVALQALPHLLSPPAPPPLANDVGLPQAVPPPEPVPRFLSDHKRPKRTTHAKDKSLHLNSRFEQDGRRPKGTTGSAATAVNGSRPLPPSVEAALYRICQEALTNVARHAGAERATVRLVATPDRVRLAVEDDGSGFDAAGVPEERHGIVGMRERAEVLGGTLEVRSEPGEGTRIEVTAPLEKL